MAGRRPRVDQKIAVHFRHLRTADAQAPAARRVDQLPGAVTGRILEGRSSRLFADRLCGLAMVLYFVHPRANGFGCGDGPAKARRGEDDGRIDAAAAVDEFHIRMAEGVLPAIATDANSLHQHVLGFRAVGAGIHAQRAADGAGNAEEEFQPADIGGGRGLGHALVERSSPGADEIALGAGLAKSSRAEPDHHARNAAIAHDQVGADADDVDREFARQMRQEISEIVLIRRGEQHLRRTADPKPGQLRQRLVGQ